jgi:putative transposase
MSPPLRIEYPDAWYHVMNRGRRAEDIFTDELDYVMFTELKWYVNHTIRRYQIF